MAIRGEIVEPIDGLIANRHNFTGLTNNQLLVGLWHKL